jgi:RHS repeat-associated protein
MKISTFRSLKTISQVIRHRRLPRYFVRQLISLILTITLVTNPLLAAPQGFSMLGQELSYGASFWWNNSGWAAKTAKWFTQTKPVDTKGWDGKGAPPNTPPDAKEQEKQSDRDYKVQSIEISPRDVVIQTGEKIIFTAIAYDKSGNMIPGVKYTWSGNDNNKNRPMGVTPRGEFSSPVAGNYKVTVEALGKKDSVKVDVVGEKLNPKDAGIQGEPVSSQDAPKPEKPAQKIGWLNSAPKEAAPLRQNEADKLAKLTDKSTRAAATAAMAVQGGTYDYYQWNASNYTTADDPGREVGQLPGHALDGGAGSGNFQFSASLLALDGRGIDINQSLHYNSRLWHKNGTDMYFDIDNDYIPGWTFGFGKIITAGTGFMLIDADGTRHSYGGNTWSYSVPNTSLQGFDGYTKDGSFINYYARGYKPQFNSTILEAWAKLPNGTKIVYGASTKLTAYPTLITDANGNSITITYVNNQGPQIDTIMDTLGRQIKFKYVDLLVGSVYKKVMVAVTAPGFNGGADRVVAQFAYDTASLTTAGANYGFTGVTTRVQNATVARLKAIYYPATNTGYWFGDTDSYSNYGMIRKISERRAMVCSNPNDTTAQANITSAGNISREMVYSSGTIPGYSGTTGSLTDVPTYSTLTEDWAGRQAGIPKPVTEYSVSPSTTTTTKITRRDENTTDGITSVQITDNNSASLTFGLALEDYTLPSKNSPYTAAIHKSKVYWEVPDLNTYPAHYGAPRPNHTEATDERGQMTATYYDYGLKYNQVADVREYGWSGQLLRRTHTDYINTTNYIGYWSNNAYGSYFGRHIYSLPSAIEVYGADNTTRVSRTEFIYDQQLGQSLINTPNAPMHQLANDPYDQGYQSCDWVWNPNIYPNGDYEYICNQYYTYDSGTDYRGNVTNTKRYADAQNYTSDTKALVETRSYDICGNVRTTAPVCCSLTTFNYTASTAYTWASMETFGSSTDTTQQNTHSMVYDFNTSLQTSVTDANGRTSTVTYDATTLRPAYEYSPTGSYSYHSYYDDLMAVVDFKYEAGLNGSNWADRVDKYMDGYGRVGEEISFTIGFDMDVANSVYDQFGRVQKKTRPYRRNANWTLNETPQWTNYTYDIQNRVVSTAAPDGSITYNYYNESTYPNAAASATAKGTILRVKDAWGRERWGRSDEKNQLVEVVEPDPAGSGAVATNGLLTTYSYNDLGTLNYVSQGIQTRSFRYDSLGRMTHQKLAEQDATLNDAGDFVATWNGGTKQYVGGNWSEVFSYDTSGKRAWKKDARGVKTVFTYGSDPLNRLQSISYDTSNVPTNYATNLGAIAAAPAVTYGYENASGQDKTRLKTVFIDQGLSTPLTGMGDQSFTYDGEARLSNVAQSFTGINSASTLNTSYAYDSLGRVKDVTYPAQFGITTVGKVVHHNFDIASRVTSLTYDGSNFASNLVYNAADQTKSLSIGSQISENYTFDLQTGLLTNQQVVKGSTALMNLDYNFTTNNATNNVGVKTGQLTFIKDNLNQDRNRSYSYDKLGRLNTANGGITTPKTWNQTYSYDRFGNRTSVTKSGNDASNAAVALDGLASVSYATANNRITSAGYVYDPAGNQVQTNENSFSKTFQYDAAGRLVKILNASNQQIGQNIYGASNQRLIFIEGVVGAQTTTYYAWDNGTVIAEYSPVGASLQWSKGYVYLGGRLLASLTNNSGAVTTQFQHPDRLGTRLTTDTSGTVLSENVNLPFGTSMPNATALNGSGQPTQGEGYLPSAASQSTKKRFTSYDRSVTTGLDYAVNRQYSYAQGRFTQVDPIDMNATSLEHPQTLNLYAYCGNDPINYDDPDGLSFFSKLWGKIKGSLKWIGAVIAVVVAVLVIMAAPALFPTLMFKIMGIASALANAGSSVAKAFGFTSLANWLGVAAAAASFGTAWLDVINTAKKLKVVLKLIAEGASLASKTLSATGHKMASQVFGLIKTGLNFAAGGIKSVVDTVNKKEGYSFSATPWEIFKTARSLAEQSATLAHADKVAGWLNVLGIVEDLKEALPTGSELWKSPPSKLEKELKNVSFRLILTDKDKARWDRQHAVKIFQTFVSKFESSGDRVAKAWGLAH